jgi:hypothetical protein
MLPIDVIDAPKFKLAASLLGISRPALYGYISVLYRYAVDQSPPRFDSPAELEAVAEWDGEPGRLASALVQCRLAEAGEGGALCLCDLYGGSCDNLARATDSSVSTPSSTRAADAASVARAVVYRWLPKISPLKASAAELVSIIVALETSMDPDEARTFWAARLNRFWPDGEIPEKFRRAVSTALKNVQGQSNLRRGTLRNPAQWLNAQVERIAEEEKKEAQKCHDIA